MASMNGTITLELNAEDRERLDKFVELMSVMTDQKKQIFFGGVDLASEPKPILEGPTDPLPPYNAPEVEQPEPPKYTAAEIQLKVQKLAAPASGKRDAVRQIVKEYADRVSEIPEDKFAEVMGRLTALEEGKA